MTKVEKWFAAGVVLFALAVATSGTNTELWRVSALFGILSVGCLIAALSAMLP